MIIPVSLGFILMMLFISMVLGKMVFENILLPILIIGGIIAIILLLNAVLRKVREDCSDIEGYFEDNTDEWNR